MNIINSFPIGERKRDEDFSCSADKSKKKQSTSELRQIDSISLKLVIQKKREGRIQLFSFAYADKKVNWLTQFRVESINIA